jgi:flagellar basal body-associated protein FliL
VNRMNKKRFLILAGVALIVLLLAGLGGAVFVFAQEPTLPIPFGWHGGGRGRGGFAWAGGGPWTMFDTAAEALGMTPEELFAELRAGKSPAEIAEEQGVEAEAVFEAMNAARGEVMQQAIEQAVEDGHLSQEQADWLLKGLEQGLFPMGQGFGYGWDEGECPCGSH